MIKFQPTEFPKHQITGQLGLKLHAGKSVPKPQKKRPKQRQGGIFGPPGLALAFRQKRLKGRPVERAKRRMIKQLVRGEKGGLADE